MELNKNTMPLVITPPLYFLISCYQ